MSLFVLLFVFSACFTDSYSLSPYLFDKQIQDQNENDLIYSETNNVSHIINPSSNIVSVDHYSDGKILNATLWLEDTFDSKPPYKEVDYGMFIDSDFDNKTGFNGIDYKVEISWNKTNSSWDYGVEKWSPTGDIRKIEKIYNYDKYANFFGSNNTYALLSLDLEKIHFPQKYKVFFYADFRLSSDKLVIDTTRWITIPPLNLFVSVAPNSIDIFKGQSIPLEVTINSTPGYEPVVNLYNQPKYAGMDLKFKLTNKTIVPIYGTTTIPLTIDIYDNASLGPKTVYLFANSTFPPGDFLNVHGINVSSENILTKTGLLINIKDRNLLDVLEMISNKIGGFTQLIISIITFLAGFGLFRLGVFNRRKKWFD